MFNLNFDRNELKEIIREVIREDFAVLLCGGGTVVDPQYKDDGRPTIKGIKKLADYLGISKSTAQKLKNRGIIKGFQPPWAKTILFEKEKVKLALQENREFEKILTRARKRKQRCV